MKRIHLTIEGKVQGVGFRNFARMKASLFKVKGFVKNVGLDKVEIVAEGDEKSLKLFSQEINRGPLTARIDNFSLVEQAPTGEFSTFEIRF